MTERRDRLYDLLPAIHRMRDAEQGGPLRELLDVIAEQVAVVEDDMLQLYDNWFIETAEEWAVPYIADLIGYLPAPADLAAGTGDTALAAALVPRRAVANTIRHRRRKGALALLEELAADVAGWPARAVELYTLLGRTQNGNHLQPDRGRTVDLRQGGVLDAIDGPFDASGHTVDVRRITSHRTTGRFNIPSVGVFVWRLRPYSVSGTACALLEQIGHHCYTFSVLGNDTQLFTRPRPGHRHPAERLDVPAPIRRADLVERTPAGAERATAAYYGEDASLAVYAPGWPTRGAPQPIPAAAVVPADLSDWRRYRPVRGTVAVDPELGRIVFPPGQTPPRGVWARYHYGFSADVGGGEYDRPIPVPTARAVTRFRRDHFLNAAALAAELRDSNAELAVYLRERWLPERRALLDAYAPGSAPSPALVAAMVAELDAVLADDALYGQSRFPVLPDDLRALAAQAASGSRRLRINRLLLEAAYPAFLAVGYQLFRVGDRAAQAQPPRPSPLGPHLYAATIAEALTRWATVAPRVAIIELAASDVYVEPFDVALGRNQVLHLRAANRARPVIRLLDRQTDRPDSLTVSFSAGSRFVLDGVLVSGRSVRFDGLERSEDADYPAAETDGPAAGDGAGACDCDAAPRGTIRHSTLVPGWALDCDCEPRMPAEPSLELVNFEGVVEVEHSIIGSILVTDDEVRTDPVVIGVADTVLDATSSELEAVSAAGGGIAHVALTVARSTVVGKVLVDSIELGENSIFDGAVLVARRQQGCLRFCFVEPGSRTPRRYHCEPDGAATAAEEGLRARAREQNAPVPSDADIQAVRDIAAGRVRPELNSTRYGRPDYCQLALTCPPEISRGADDESEMGVFHDLYQPQRADGLGARLDEYTPAGMDAGVLFAT